MANITKDTFVRSMAEANGISIKQSREEVNRVLEHILTVVPKLADGEKLDLTGVIQFEVSDLPARKGRNPQNGEEIDLAPSRKVVTRPMATLKSKVKGE